MSACICHRWPASGDAVNTTPVSCQLCQRSFSCPYDSVYPAFSLTTQQSIPMHPLTSTASPDYGELMASWKHGKLTLRRSRQASLFA